MHIYLLAFISKEKKAGMHICKKWNKKRQDAGVPSSLFKAYLHYSFDLLKAEVSDLVPVLCVLNTTVLKNKIRGLSCTQWPAHTSPWKAHRKTVVLGIPHRQWECSTSKSVLSTAAHWHSYSPDKCSAAQYAAQFTCMHTSEGIE